MRKGSVLVLLVIFFLFTLAPYTFAQENVWEMAKSDRYGKKLGGMLGRGFINIATCFVDLIVHTVEGTKSGPPLLGTMTGLGSGIGCTALRVTSGALDVVTSWVPGFNGFPVSRSYSNCIESEQEAAAPVQDVAPITAPSESMNEPQVVQAQEPAPVKVHDAMEYVKK